MPEANIAEAPPWGRMDWAPARIDFPKGIFPRHVYLRPVGAAANGRPDSHVTYLPELRAEEGGLLLLRHKKRTIEYRLSMKHADGGYFGYLVEARE